MTFALASIGSTIQFIYREKVNRGVVVSPPFWKSSTRWGDDSEWSLPIVLQGEDEPTEFPMSEMEAVGNP